MHRRFGRTGPARVQRHRSTRHRSRATRALARRRARPRGRRAARRVAHRDARDRHERARVDAHRRRPAPLVAARTRPASALHARLRQWKSTAIASDGFSRTCRVPRGAPRRFRGLRQRRARVSEGRELRTRSRSARRGRRRTGPRRCRARGSTRTSTSCACIPISRRPRSTTRPTKPGLLLWQDLPMEGGYARGVRRQAARQARAMVELLGHHPSIVMWCAHDAPLGDDAPAARHRQRDRSDVGQRGARPFDRSRDRALTTGPGRSSAARARATTPTCGSDGGTARSPGSRRPSAPCPVSAGSCRRSVRSRCPTPQSGCTPSCGPSCAWDDLAEHHGMERSAFDAHVPVGDAKSFDEWREATQAYQAALLQLQIEDLRRCKGTPCGGFAVFCLADPSPAVGFGVLDHERVAKRGVRRAARRVPTRAADGRPADGQRARGERHPHGRSSTRRSSLPSTAATRVSGGATSTPTRSSFVGIGRSRRCRRRGGRRSSTPTSGRVANRYPLVILEAGRARKS